jgi:Protein of unknown function (DUF3551)
MRNLMLALLAAATVTAIASSPAAAAPAYPYCLQSQAFGTQCSYPTYQACQTTASGLGYDCILNPRVAYAPPSYAEPRRSRRNYSY